MILREIIDGAVNTCCVHPTFLQRYDLVVVGLGTAGAMALIAAARENISVLGIEQLDEMGGTGTAGEVTGYYYGAQGGLYTEFDQKAKDIQPDILGKKIDGDALAFVLDTEAREAGAEIQYHCIVTGVYLEEDTVIGLRIFRNGKESAIAARYFIDATGDAVVCHLAGCESTIGRSFDDQTQPVTLANISVNDIGEVKRSNIDAGYMDQYDPRVMGQALVHINSQLDKIDVDDTKEQMKTVAAASLFGIREGRLIKGRKTLRLEEVADWERDEAFPLFYAYANVDHHGKDTAFEDTELCDWLVVSGLWGVLMSVPVPIEVLLPEGMKNIMVAGRCLSVDHNLAPCVRMKRDMKKCGEAAAYICCDAIQKNISLWDVKYTDIVNKLQKTKCLDESNNVKFMERIGSQYYGNELPELKTAEEIVASLDGEKPGWAIWTARCLAIKAETNENSEITKQDLIRKLKQCLVSDKENLSRHSAMALAIMGETEGLTVLRKMAEEPDNYIPKSSLKYVHTRGIAAIYLLGRLGDEDSVKLLLDIVERKGKTPLTEFTFDEFYSEPTDVSTQYVLFAARALTEIAVKKSAYKAFIKSKLIALLEESDDKLYLTLKNNQDGRYDVKSKLLEYLKRKLG